MNPPFDNIGGKGRFCSIHKNDEMVNVRQKRCEYKDCDVSAGFDLPGKNGKFCFTHKTEQMISCNKNRCIYISCEMSASFGNPGETPQFCSQHKNENMNNIKNKVCEYDKCTTRPNFNIKGTNSARFCATHKSEDMINVTAKRCEYINCEQINCYYDLPGGKGRFCIDHKSNGMINIKIKYCKYDKCQNTAYYGKPGYDISYCIVHREKGMIRKSNTKCKQCKNLAIWGTNWTPKHCDLHKISNEDNLVERRCSSCSLYYVLDKDDKCENCNPIAFATIRLAKQNALMNYLDTHNLKGNSTDKIIDHGICGKERPDRIYELPDKIVILECDENQHQERQCACEQARMVNIGQSFGGIPVYFIRWNPDDYTPENDKQKPESLTKRYKLLKDLLYDIINNKYSLPNALLSALYMYYEGWSCLGNEKWHIITKFE